jgi:hypothetical protein
VANRLSAAALTQEAKTGSTTLALVVRVRSSLLLKTDLPTASGVNELQKTALKQRTPDAS